MFLLWMILLRSTRSGPWWSRYSDYILLLGENVFQVLGKASFVINYFSGYLIGALFLVLLLWFEGSFWFTPTFFCFLFVNLTLSIAVSVGVRRLVAESRAILRRMAHHKRVGVRFQLLFIWLPGDRSRKLDGLQILLTHLAAVELVLKLLNILLSLSHVHLELPFRLLVTLESRLRFWKGGTSCLWNISGGRFTSHL